MTTTNKTGVWIDWHGGECPLPEGVEFMYKLRATPHISRKGDNPCEYRWAHDRFLANADIVAYLIVPTYVPPAKLERWKIVKRTQPVGYGCTFEYLTHYAINDATSTKLGNLVATTDGEYALLTRFAKLLNEVAP